MKPFGFTFLILLSALCLNAQPKQELSMELEKRNGFKTIKLNQHIDSVKGAVLKKEFLEKDEFPAKLYEVKNEALESIGEVRVKSIEIKAYKDLVYEIEVHTEKDTRLMQGMEMALGKAIYNYRTKTYNWGAPSLGLSFVGEKNSLKLHYKSYPVWKMMHEDRGKKVDKIASDF